MRESGRLRPLFKKGSFMDNTNLVSTCYVRFYNPEPNVIVFDTTIYLSMPELGRYEDVVTFTNPFSAKKYILDKVPAIERVAVAA